MELLAGLLQQQSHHQDACDHERWLHHNEMQHSALLHDQEITLERSRFREAETASIQQAHGKLKLNVKLAERDAVRDALSHRSQITQSIMLVDAVVLGCDYMMVYQINLPEDLGQRHHAEAIAVVYCAMLGLSIALVILSISLALALQQRIVNYDLHKHLKRYHPCGRHHPNFSDYFECHCLRFEVWALRTFYAGMVMLLGTGGTLLYAVLAVTYGLVGIGVGSAIGVGFGIVLLMLGDTFVPSRTHPGPQDLVGGGDYEGMFSRIRMMRRNLKKKFST